MSDPDSSPIEDIKQYVGAMMKSGGVISLQMHPRGTPHD